MDTTSAVTTTPSRHGSLAPQTSGSGPSSRRSTALNAGLTHSSRSSGTTPDSRRNSMASTAAANVVAAAAAAAAAAASQSSSIDEPPPPPPNNQSSNSRRTSPSTPPALPPRPMSPSGDVTIHDTISKRASNLGLERRASQLERETRFAAEALAASRGGMVDPTSTSSAPSSPFITRTLRTESIASGASGGEPPHETPTRGGIAATTTTTSADNAGDRRSKASVASSQAGGGEDRTRNSKAVYLLGRDAAPEKVHTRLGSSTFDRMSMRRADDAFKAEQERQRQRLLHTVLLARPTAQQLEAPDMARRSVKASRVLGDPSLAPLGGSLSASALLGHDGSEDAVAMKRANDALAAERLAAAAERERIGKMALENALQAETDRRLPKSLVQTGRPVSLKALKVFGDAELEDEAKKNVYSRDSVNPKVIQMMGSIHMAPPKVLDVLGSSEKDEESRRAADMAWDEERKSRNLRDMSVRLSQKPTLEQLEVGDDVATALSTTSQKALKIFGDQTLTEQAMRSIPRSVTPKAIEILGEPQLAGKKASKQIGSPEGDVTARKMANEHHLKEMDQKKTGGKSRGTTSPNFMWGRKSKSPENVSGELPLLSPLNVRRVPSTTTQHMAGGDRAAGGISPPPLDI